MNKTSKEFLSELLLTPSPSGCEQTIQRLIHDRLKSVADFIEPDVHGNLVLGINTEAKRRVMLAAHCDQIAFMVKHVSKDGYLSVEAVGGVDEGTVLGSQLIVHSKGGPIEGVFGKKPIHLQTKSEKEQVPLLDDMWIDIGAKDKDDAERMVELGDYVTYKLGVTELWNNCIAAPGLDNKAGLFVALEALRLCASAKLAVALYIVSTVQEEVGLRGADTAGSALLPEVGLAIDVTLASDDPANDKDTTVPCKLGKGPCISHGPNTNPVVERLLLGASKQVEIPHQRSSTGELEGNDAKTIQTVGAGVATAAVGIPLRNMHTQIEIVNLDDLDNTVRLVAEFVKSINHETDFRPFYSDRPCERRHGKRAG